MHARPYPSYCSLAPSELEQRASEAARALDSCRICPRQCKANRAQGQTGVCNTGRFARVASCGPHLGEEDCLRGWRGSGTIFFSGCNLGCVFCQNWDISHECDGEIVSPAQLSGIMLKLQEMGCHNINWVTPTHVLPQVIEALALAAEEGLQLPIVYNTGGYDTVESLRLLDGIVDIYMPDFKTWEPETAHRLMNARDYPEAARRAITEMHRQVGDLVLDDRGLARRGLLIRHLVMPNDVACTKQFARWLASEISPNTFINLMDQYRPAGAVASAVGASDYSDIQRHITSAEYRSAMAAAAEAGLHRFDQRRAAMFRF